MVDYWKPQYLVEKSFQSPVPVLLLAGVLAFLLLDVVVVSIAGISIDWKNTLLSAGVHGARLVVLSLVIFCFGLLVGRHSPQVRLGPVFTVVGIIQLVGALFGFLFLGIMVFGTNWPEFASVASQTPAIDLAPTLSDVAAPEISFWAFGVLLLFGIILVLFSMSLLYRLVRKMVDRGFLVNAMITLLVLVITAFFSFGF